jgi:antitoxin component YwqK of YwqJK toxin-antitoxin module
MFAKILISVFSAFSLSAACDAGLWLNAVDLRRDSTIASLFNAVDDSLYEINKTTEWSVIANACNCIGGAGGIFLQSRHVDLMGTGWHLNWCDYPDSVVFFAEKVQYRTKDLILKTSSILFGQVQTLKKLIMEKGCETDSVYEFSDKELIPENAKKGIYVVDIPVPSENVLVPQSVRLLKIYYPNGKLAREIQFSQGLRNGYDKRYFPSGKKYIVNHYKNGLMDGMQIKHFRSGKKSLEVKYKNGKHAGIVKDYSEQDGSVIIKEIDELTGFEW